MENKQEKHRLTKDIYPDFYKLDIVTDLDNFTFTGKVNIQVVFTKDADSCVINCKQLIIKSIKVDDTDNINFIENAEHIENETIEIKHKFTVGKHNIMFIYDGKLTDSMDGYYRSKYIDYRTGETKYISTTQFESTDARKAFPCFDEPNFKAKFELTMTAAKEYVILSNTEPVSITINETDKTKTVKFGVTPIMSTYLLAFIVGDLVHITDENIYNNSKTKIKIYSVPNDKNNKEKMRFALDVCRRGLDWFNDWFNIDYPLSKLDMVAIPDFSAGAMENWGLITFRETDLFCDSKTDILEKQQNATTICHELAHQWFGNLVTMEWWSFLWLNESMATYFGWHVAGKLFPDWNLDKLFIKHEYDIALDLDSLLSSHPIESEVKKANEIQSVFDNISYAKGACVVRFMVDYLGEEKFQKGMQIYMEKNKYKNTTSDDLWNALSSDGNDIKTLMHSWTKQMGYPLITLSKSNSSDEMIIKQEYFTHDTTIKNNKSSKSSKSSKLWHIPLDILTDEGIIKVILNDKDSELRIKNYKDIIINPKRIAFCRVNYDNIEPNLDMMTTDMLTYYIDDLFALATFNYINFNKVFDVMNKIDFNKIHDYNFWTIIISNIKHIIDLSENDNQNLKQIISKINESFINIYEHANYELRELIIKFLVDDKQNKYKEISEWGLNYFRKDKWSKYKYAVLKIVGMYGTESDYNKMIEIYKTTTNAQIREVMQFGISYSNNQKNINLIFSGVIRHQDLWIFMRQLMNNKELRNIIKKFIYQNWDKIVKIYPMGTAEILHLTKIVGLYAKTEDELNEYKSFMDKNKIAGTEKAVEQTIERIMININNVKNINNIKNN